MRRLIAIALLGCFIFTGCWDMRELNELGLVMAVGVDKSKDGYGYTVTVQVARPKAASGGQNGSQGGGAPVWIGTADGKTIFDAIRNIAQFSSRRIMWAHNNIIIIGESLAEKGIEPVIDFFTHNPELRMKTWIAVCHGEASDYVSAETGMETIPAISLAQLFLYSDLPAKSISSSLVEVFRDYMSDTTQPLIGELRRLPAASAGQSQIELSGGAVFKDGKLAGWLAPEEVRGLSWVRKEVNNAIITVALDKEGNKTVAAELKEIKVTIKSNAKKRIPSIAINITAIANISEQDKPVNMEIDDFKGQINELLKKRVEGEVRTSIDKVQKDYESDVLYFGRIIHIQNREAWYGWIKKDWSEIYPQIAVSVDSDIEVRSSTLFQIPLKESKIQEEEKNESKDK